MHYCNECSNLLDIQVTVNNKLKLICTNDYQQYDPASTDTLIESENYQAVDSIEKYKFFISNAAFDPTNLKVINPCKKCSTQVITMVRITDKEQVIYICQCGNIWT